MIGEKNMDDQMRNNFPPDFAGGGFPESGMPGMPEKPDGIPRGPDGPGGPGGPGGSGGPGAPGSFNEDELPPGLLQFLIPKPISFSELTDAEESGSPAEYGWLYQHGLLPDLVRRDKAWWFDSKDPIDQEMKQKLLGKAEAFMRKEIDHTCMNETIRGAFALALYQAMRDKGLMVLDHTFAPETLEVPAHQVWSAKAGKVMAMSVNGVQIDPKPGFYTGKVEVRIQDELTLVQQAGATNHVASALFIDENGVVEEKSTPAVVQGGTVTEKAATGIHIFSDGNDFNGIVVGGKSDYLLKDSSFLFSGHGTNDFVGSGAPVLAQDQAKLTLEGVTIHSVGALRSCVAARGDSQLLVKDSYIYGKNGTDMDFSSPSMKEVPWVLGIRGNQRATNALDNARVIYLNSTVYSEGWGALSTDSSNCHMTAVNTCAGNTGNSGYAMYVSNDDPSKIYGCRFFAATSGLIIHSVACGADIGPSTEDLVGKELYSLIPQDRRDANTEIHSDRFGFMWHDNHKGLLNLRPGTYVNVVDTVFFIKSGVPDNNRCYPVIRAEKCTLKSKRGILLHLMQTDDAGMGPGGPGSPDMWAKSYTVPEVVHGAYAASAETADDTTAELMLKDMETEGAIFNSVWQHSQNLSVELVNCTHRGAISSATARHKNVRAGDLITPESRDEIGQLDVDISPVAVNGVIVALKDGSEWIPAESWISSLTVEAGSVLRGSLLVDGKPTEIMPGVTYSGQLHIIPDPA